MTNGDCVSTIGKFPITSQLDVVQIHVRMVV